MKSAKIAFVTTTINTPEFIDDFADNFQKNNHKDVVFYIIGDLKTPSNTSEFIEKMNKKYNYEFKYYDAEDQKILLADNQDLWNLIPLNCGVRKLVGNYLAYKEGCDYLIMIDDDNFLEEKDYLSALEIFKEGKDITLFQSETGWFNIYKNIVEENNLPIYPRGFSWANRFKDYKESISVKKIKVCSINGFVLSDPDIDAITRLYHPINVIKMKENVPKQFGLYPGTWTSFNNQNTIIPRYMIPVYFTPPSTGRNSDIWGSYIVCKLADHFKEAVVFGAPLVRQIRNPHDLWDDLRLEQINNEVNDIFLDLLRSLKLNGNSYKDVMSDLCNQAIKKIDKSDLDPEKITYIRSFFEEYQIWVSLFTNI